MSALHSKTLLIKTSERCLFRSRSAAFSILMTFHFSIRPLGIAHLILPTQPEDILPFFEGVLARHWTPQWRNYDIFLFHGIPLGIRNKYNIYRDIQIYCILNICGEMFKISWNKMWNRRMILYKTGKIKVSIKHKKKPVNYSLFLCSTYNVTLLCFIGV
jgi:hypothetical protein